MMANILYLILFCFIAAGLQAVNCSPPVGQPASDSNVPAPKLPTFPSAFSALIEVNIVNKNYTALFKEFYDFEANQGSIERTKDGKTHRSIYDYNLDEKISIDLNAKNCTVHSISGGRGFNFFGNNNSHIESVSQLFRFAKQYNESYMGVVPVRGIRCNHWRAQIVHNHSSYYLDYYFSVPNWKTTWQNSTVVRAAINGTRSATPHVSAHAFYHVYDFIDFHPGSPDPSNFQLPEGYYCRGLKGENKTVPQVPSAFSMEFEAVTVSRRNSSRNNTVSTWKEVYDFEKKIVLLKLPNWFNAGPLLTIYDFNTGIIYNISSGKTGTVCETSYETLNNDRWFAVDSKHHHIRMKTTQELFNVPKRNGSSPLVYKGVASVRGISADIWVGKVTGMNRKTNTSYEVVMEFYFSKPNWRFMSELQSDEHKVPVRLNFYSERGQSVMNLFNFDAESAETTAFDVKPCFSWEEQRFIQFALNDKYQYDKYATSRQFLLAVTKTISTVANVSVIRVNGIRLQNSRGAMVVTFILLNKTQPVRGEVEVIVYPEKGLMDALNALKDSVQSGNFKVEFHQEKIYATKSSFYVGFWPSSPPHSGSPLTTAKPSSQGGSKLNTKGVSSGAAAGISFLMLAVGICGGLLIAHVIMKRRGTSLFQYQRQN